MKVRPISTLARRLRPKLENRIRSFRLSIYNRFDRRPVAGDPSQPVVSLTTYGSRAKTVHLTIESIARGKVRPSRLLLWVNDSALVAKPNPHLRRLQRRGLEIRLTEDFGPHKKYFPYAIGEPNHITALVTADDDVIYPPYWFEELSESHRRQPSS